MAKAKRQLTPLMQQFWEIKSAHMDKVLLFRMGDFFEMFHEDAIIAAPILNIALTSRNKKSADDTPMCGVPHHSIAGPIAKLLAAGHKVAICDQVEDPKEAKGIVKRAVTRILSPGMVYDPETLDQLESNYLCSYDKETLSFLETTTGEAFYYKVKNYSEIKKIMNIVQPTELVLTERQKQFELESRNLEGPHLSVHEEVKKQEGVPNSAQRLVSYAMYMQGASITSSLMPFEERQLQSRMQLPATVVRHLEIFETYKGETKGSLFQAVNRTKTSSGARLLKQWLCFPLADEKQIEERLDQVTFWMENLPMLKEIRKVLGNMGDIERRLGKISNPNCNPRDLLSLADSLRAGLAVSALSSHFTMPKDIMALAEALVHKIESIIEDEAPISFKTGGVIKKGYTPHLDELIELADNSQGALLEMEAREKETTGIPSLKIRYNSVFGYYIEVTKTHTDKVPDHYKRKQTLTNAERYLTQELQELEDKILSARSKRVEVELEVFASLKQEILKSAAQLILLARKWSELDIYTSLAWLATEFNYARPSFSGSGELHIQSGRHPVVEQEVELPFVPNSLNLGSSECLLLTGPNMAGKSTFMRQVAVISLLAQIGSYVPAKAADLPIFDRVFTRIGASDFLSEGLSTFMVEMQETAEMLKEANENSLVILDEVGRGTSTYDGMSLAQAILEFLITKRKSMTLFATHYHELTQLDRKHPQVHNAHMTIREEKGEINFLYTLVNGPANRSYGIQVARLAGLPGSVTQRAQVLLEQLESFKPTGPQPQMSLMDMDKNLNFSDVESSAQNYDDLIEKIRSASLQTMTPIEAMNEIARWQEELG